MMAMLAASRLRSVVLLLVVLAVHLTKVQGGTTLLPGSSACTWTPTANSNSPGGNAQLGASSLTACQSACQSLSGCLGIDWNPNAASGQQCWTSTSNTISTYTGWTHYQMSCPSACSWNSTANTNSPGGTAQPSISTLAACQSQCLTTTSCSGIDFIPTASAGQQCWFSTSTTANVGSYPGCTHYTYICSTTASATPTASPTGSTNGYICTWTPTANSNSPGGNVQSSITSLTACEALCQASFCPGVDWNPTAVLGQQCWISTSSTVNVNNYPGVTHYGLVCNVKPTVPPSGANVVLVVKGSVIFLAFLPIAMMKMGLV